MNPRHCFSANPPNPPFQPTRVDVWHHCSGSSARAAERGRWANNQVGESKWLKVVGVHHVKSLPFIKKVVFSNAQNAMLLGGGVRRLVPALARVQHVIHVVATHRKKLLKRMEFPSGIALHAM